MKNLKEVIPNSQPDIVDPLTKKGQKYLRDIALYGVEEMFRFSLLMF